MMTQVERDLSDRESKRRAQIPAEALNWPVSATARLSVLAVISCLSDLLTSRYTFMRFSASTEWRRAKLPSQMDLLGAMAQLLLGVLLWRTTIYR
jgi:hypothetical protein